MQPSPTVPRLRWIAPILLAAGSLAGIAVEPSAAPPKTHRLFMGSNLTVESRESSYPVRDVRKDSFVVKGPGGDLIVDPQDPKVRLKINDALKLTDLLATLDKLTIERAYTPANDPMQKFADAARVNAYLADATDTATAATRRAEGMAGYASVLGASGDSGAGAAMASASRMAAEAQAASDRTQAMNNMDVVSIATGSTRLTSDLAAEAYDAVRVTFTASSPRPLTTPYAVIFIRFLEAKDQRDTASVWVYAEKLPDIDEHPRKITIFRGGFPPGYHIDSYHVHLYEGTAEIATNVSRKLVALTTDEAFQYSVIQHIGGHRDQTLAPAKARYFWPQGLPTRLLPDKLNRTLYVKVDKTGRAQGIFEDQSCGRPVVDPEIAALAPELRFFPALEKGKPVAGVAEVKLGAGN